MRFYTAENERPAVSHQKVNQQENLEEPQAPAEVDQELEHTPKVERTKVIIKPTPTEAEARAVNETTTKRSRYKVEDKVY